MKRILTVAIVLFLFTQSMADEKKRMMGSGMMGEGMMGSMMGDMMREMTGMMSNPWFYHGVTLTLQNAEKLGLSDKQKEQLEDLRDKYTKDIIRQDAELDITEMDIDKLLREPSVDLAKVKDAIKKANDIRAQIRSLRIEAFVEARKILTDEQREKLKKLMERPPRMMGDMGGGMMKGGGMMGGESGGKSPEIQEKAVGEVTVSATLKNPNDIGGKEELEFEIKLDTHTVDLDRFSFNKGVILKDDKGKPYKPTSVEPAGSGHHREAEIKFKNPGKVKFIELVLKDVAGAKETVFKWQPQKAMMEEE